MRLVDDWRAVLRKAWSVKFNLAATAFGAAEVAVAIWQPAGVPNGVFAGGAAAVSIFANVSRIMAQKELHGTDK
ncbi:hypothetical protein PO883_05050 [Massilia sp. DJPM01]|uniref:DUF7940 domain-containing protein n=1 Tax=Massilia sp. DJPM01 TaxID=3024404 RepID=UPI00259E9032|nr:hypothetical protein [Massilia sp. DJPM01]MDM5176562.1 hypothetical protein [Massilia sp. DJPM01]